MIPLEQGLEALHCIALIIQNKLPEPVRFIIFFEQLSSQILILIPAELILIVDLWQLTAVLDLLHIF